MSRALLETLLSGDPLSIAEADALFAAMLDGGLEPATIAAALAALRLRGESAMILTAGAAAMRERAIRPDLPAKLRPLADNCGTGGDGSGSFNISTAAAIVASALGLRVAKHGNRSVSSRCGSADLLFAAGYPDSLSPAATVTLLERTNFTFFFAPQFHPSMKHVMPVRKALGVRTVFNLLGPLANPLAPEVQLVGVGVKAALEPMAGALAALGSKSALVVHGRDGTDEISATTATDAVRVDGGLLKAMTIEPKMLGLTTVPADLAGGDPTENLKTLGNLLAGKLPGLADAVALNAGALLWIAGRELTLEAGLAIARAAIEGGRARAHFEAWLTAAQSLAKSTTA